MITEEDIEWKFMSSINYSNKDHCLLRDNKLGIQCEKVSGKTHFRKCSTSFFIDNDPREFLSLDTLIDAYNEKFKFEEENPHEEVVYVKVIKKREK